MKIKLWRGSHGKEIRDLIRSSWEKEELLILYPPKTTETSFLPVIEQAQFPESPVFGVFSTGSTGQKLVLYSKKNIESSLQAILSLFNEKKLGKIFCYPQPFHTFGLILGYCHSLLYDREFVSIDGQYTAEHHKRWLAATDPSLLTLGTPTHFKDLLDYVAKEKANPGNSYSAIIGAARVEVALWRAVRAKLRIAEPSIGYGATEASPGITHLSPGKEPKEDGEVGYVLKHLQTEILGDAGIEFSGPSVCMATVLNGVLEFPEKILIRDRLEERADGVLVYKGRSEVLLNRGGEKFPLEEMENLLKKKLGIETVCVAVPHPRLGEELGILARGDNSVKTAIYAVLKETFGREFDTGYFAAALDLPLSPSLKIDQGEPEKDSQ